MNKDIKKNDHINEEDVEEFLRFLSKFVPDKSIDGARYLIDYWNKWSEDSQYKDKAEERWAAMDLLSKEVFSTTNLSADAINNLICKSIPESFKNFPIWGVKTLHVAGRDISPSELFDDPFTCLLAWCGVLGIHDQTIAPGTLLNKNGQYLYEGLTGSMSNLGHLFARPEWRFLVVGEIARQYNLKLPAGKEIFDQIKASREELETLVYFFKKVIAWIQSKVEEHYTCMSSANSFYGQCLYAYNPGINIMHVRSTTSGAVIPIEKKGGALHGKHSARKDYFEKGLLGPGSENIKIYYQWDHDRTAIKLAKEQEKAEKEGRGVEHKNEATDILSKYLVRPNIELSEGSFSGIWQWKQFYTLVSNNRVAFSGRDEKLKSINHGLWVNHHYKSFLMTCLEELKVSNKLTVQEKKLLEQGVPEAERLHELISLLYRVEKKLVLKPYNETMNNPESYAKDIIENLLQRGKSLLA